MSNPIPFECPNLEAARKARQNMLIIRDFVEWAESDGVRLTRRGRQITDAELTDLMYRHHGIDPQAAERERQQLLDLMRNEGDPT